MAGGINITWFQNFSLDKLKNLYRVLEDVWNSEQNSVPKKKLQIDPQRLAFKHSLALYIQNTIYTI